MKRVKISTHNNRIYNIWYNIKRRCLNPNNKDYKNYGARGIKICDEWVNSFMNFYNWSINNGYNDNLTIDRIDYNGNYEPSNCRWITMEEQHNNCRTNIIYNIDGVKGTLTQLCRIYNMPYTTVRARLLKEYDISMALKKPIDLSKSHKKKEV